MKEFMDKTFIFAFTTYVCWGQSLFYDFASSVNRDSPL